MTEKLKNHFSSLLGIDLNAYDVRLKAFVDKSDCFCSRCPHKCDYATTHLYGCYESARWDNKYIYYCPMDFIFLAVPITDEYNMLSQGIIAGPILIGDPADFDNFCNVPYLKTSRVNDLAEVMSALFCKNKELTAEHSNGDFLNTIYKELQLVQKNPDYPLSLEKELQSAITDGDGAEARDIVNRLLGQIFFHSNGDFEIIKARALELLVLLSRSAIDGGADVEQIFLLNNNYLHKVAAFDSLEKLSIFLSSAVNQFTHYVFEFNTVKHVDIIHKITAYIKSNYMNKISLNDIAEHVYLSKSYISKIFKEEMNINITSFINKIRIEKSKELLKDNSNSLADIAYLVGFEDQSYFTKQFKLFTGISPGKFRDTSLT